MAPMAGPESPVTERSHAARRARGYGRRNVAVARDRRYLDPPPATPSQQGRFTARRDGSRTRGWRCSSARRPSCSSVFPGPASHLGVRVAGAAAGFVGFGVLVYWHSRVEERERWFGALVAAQHATRRRAWRAGGTSFRRPASRARAPTIRSPATSTCSATRRCSNCSAGWPPTRDATRWTRWLTNARSADDVRERQAAVAELAATARASGRRSRHSAASCPRSARPLEELIGWADGGPWFTRRAWDTLAVAGRSRSHSSACRPPTPPAS